MLTIHYHSVFEEIVVLLVISVVAGILVTRMKQPAIIGYIAVGVFFGSLKLTRSTEQIHMFAEMGLALLLFVVGLKLDLHMLRSMGTVSLKIGIGQIAVTTVCGYFICAVLGMGAVSALYVSLALTLSSTIIIVKLLSDKKEADSLHGRIALGLLIVQDIAVVLIMVFLSAFSSEDSPQTVYRGALILVKGAVLVFVAWILGFKILPRLLTMLARSSELLVLSGIVWALAMAAVAELLGFSKEIGSFIAGVSLGSTPYREALGSRLSHLRDFLLIFFFIELGSGLKPSALGSGIWDSVPLSLYVLIGNPLIMMAITGVMGYRKRTSLLAGLTVGQVSEFSLVLMSLGVRFGHIGDPEVGLVTTVALTTIGLSTYMILYSQKIYESMASYLDIFERKTGHRADFPKPEVPSLEPADTMVFGLGNYGSGIAEQLEIRGRRVVGIDFDPQAILRWKNRGMEAIFGDARDTELAHVLHFSHIKWIISSIRDGETNRTLVRSLRHAGYSGRLAVGAYDERAGLDEGPDLIFSPYEDAAIQAADLVFTTEDQIARRAMDRQIEAISRHYVICGYGRMGQQIFQDLTRYGVPSVVVEQNPEQLPKLRDSNIPHVEGRASEDTILIKAGILRAKGLIAVAASDEENVFIVLTARVLNPSLFIVARSILQANEDKLRHAGADRVMSPYVLGGRRMAAAVIKPEVMDFLDLVLHDDRNETEMATITAISGTDCIGRTLREVNPWESCGVTLLAVRREGEGLHPNPSPDFVISEGDDLIVMGTASQIETARKQLLRGRSPGIPA